MNSRTHLSIYNYREEINPDYIRYQRTQSGTLGDRISFNVRNILPNALLSSKAYIKWSFSADKVRNAGPPVARNFEDEDMIFAKANILENCIRNITVSINGYNIGQYNESRYWAKYLTRSFKSDHLLFSTDGADEPKYNGSYDQAGLPSSSNLLTPGIGDDSVQEGLQLTRNNIIAGQDSATFSFTSLLNFGLFNKYYGTDYRLSGGKPAGWSHKMSNVIPYVKNLDINIDMSDIATNALNYMFGITNAAPNNEALELVNGRVTSAELVLQWIDISRNFGESTISRNYFGESADINFDSKLMRSIPDKVLMQSYTTKFNKFSLGTFGNDFLFTLPPTPSPELELYSIPDYFLIFATVDKDSDRYANVSNIFASDQAGTDLGDSSNINANESNVNFDELQIRTNINTEIVDTRWNQQELYNLTLSNSKKNYPYAQYVGGFSNIGAYPSNAYVLVRPSDIGIVKSSGSCSNRLTMQLEGQLRTTDGNVGLLEGGAFGGIRNYVLCVVEIYSSYYVELDNTGKVNAELQGRYF